MRPKSAKVIFDDVVFHRLELQLHCNLVKEDKCPIKYIAINGC